MPKRLSCTLASRLFALAVATCAASAVPEVYPLTVDEEASAVSIVTGVSLETSGTLIGDFDPVDNPTGTQTRPGLFGGSGNQPVPVTLGVAIDGEANTTPSGGLTLTADVETGEATISGLSLDLLNGSALSSELSIALSTSTFRTIDPDFFYPGLPIELPLGAADITTLTVDQVGGGDGLLIEQSPGVFALAATITADLTIAGDGFGTPIDLTQPGVTIPIAATVNIGGASARVVISIDPDAFSSPIDPGMAPAFPPIPFELPTLGSETAGVILNLSLSGGMIDGAGTITIEAGGVIQPQGCSAADLAEPFGVVDIADVVLFLQRFGAGDESADLASPFGVFDIADVVTFLQVFGAGCP